MSTNKKYTVFSKDTNTGYSGIILYRRGNGFSLSLNVGKNKQAITKRVSLGKKNDIPYTMFEFIKYRCNALDISIPKELDYSKAIKAAKELGYVPKNKNIVNSDIVIPVLDEGDIKDNPDYMYDEDSNTGYSNIHINSSKTGNPLLRLTVTRDDRELKKTWALFKDDPVTCLTKAVSLRNEFLNIVTTDKVQFDKLLNTLKEWTKEPYVIRPYPSESLTKTDRKDPGGNPIHTFVCPGCLEPKDVTMGVWNRAIDNDYTHYCNSCKQDRQHINTANGKKRTNNKSGYIGVNRYDNPARSTYGWQSRMMYEGAIVFKVFYNDTDANNRIDGRTLAAIDRDLHIREHDLPHRKNFTDSELVIKINEYKLNKDLSILKELLVC